MDESTLGNLAQDIAAANQSQLRLFIAGINTDEVTFLSFDSDGHSLSNDYRFNFMLELTTVLDLTQVIGSAAYFDVRDNGKRVYIHGLITEATYLGSRADGEAYAISLNSMLHPLKHNKQNRVYLNKQVKQIVQDVLEAAQFNNAEFEFKTQQDYPIREFTVQYDESDYDFIQRLLAYEGIFFTLEQRFDGAKLVFYDNIVDVPAFELGELTYETQSGQVRSLQTIYTLNRQSQMLTDNVRFKDYNYRAPEANLEAMASRLSNVSGQGTDYRYGENYKTLDEGDRIAKLRQEALDWRREVFIADTNCRALVPGQKFSLTNHPNESLNGDYYIVSIKHQGDQSGALAYGSLVSGMVYKSQLTLVKAGIPYRTALPPRRYKHGVFTAKVETTGGDYAYLDEQGRYHVRMPFDLSLQADGEASHPVRQAQTYSGMEYGMHFPLHAGTEVILTSVNGDVDRPIMLGALHNPELPNLVTSKNHSHNLLRTWGANELLMEDRKGEERIDLFTRAQKNSLKLDAQSGKHKIYLGTEEGEMEQYAAKTMLIESGDSQTIESGNDHILTIENSHSLHTEKKQIEFTAKTDIRFKAGNNITLSSETQNVEMKAGKDMILDVNNNMSLEIRNKNLNIVCKSGNFEIKAAKAITVKGQGGGNITVSQAGGSVVIDTGGAIDIKSPVAVNIDGDAVYLKGATSQQGGGGGGRSASGSQSGTDLSKLNLGELDVFNHAVRKAQDLAESINSPSAKEQVTDNDLTVDQVAAQSGTNTDHSAAGTAGLASAVAANPSDQTEPDKRVYGLAWTKPKAPVGLQVDLKFSVQGFSGGETAEIQVIETTATGQKNVIDTIQTTLTSGSGPQSIQWDTKPKSINKTTDTEAPLKANEYSFACSVAGISATDTPAPLCLTTNLKVKIESQDNDQTSPDKIQIKAGDGKTYIGHVQNNEATIRNVPVGTSEPAKASAKQTGYILMASPAPAPSPGTSITPVNTLPKVIHGGGWEPANQSNYNGPKQNKPGVGKMLWSLGRAATIIGGVLAIDATREPITNWQDDETGHKYQHLLDSGELTVQDDQNQIATFNVHNNKYGALPESEKKRIVATIDEYGNVTPVTSTMISPEEQQQLDFRVYQANGGQDSMLVWKNTGMPLELRGEVSKSKTLNKYDKLKEMNPAYKGEETGSVWGTKVKYLNESERNEYKLSIKDGKIYDVNDKPFDTSDASSVFGGGEGSAIFVMDKSGNIYASKTQTVGKFHHSSFLSGDAVATAGEISVKDGNITQITRRSGHYQPEEEHMDQFVNKLKSSGIDVSKIDIKQGF